MELAGQILIAAGIDTIVGDPRWLPHPVQAIGWLARKMESLTRRLCKDPFVAGVITALTVMGVTAFVVGMTIRLASQAAPWLGTCVSIYFLYAGFAMRALSGHAMDVFEELQDGNLCRAREKVARMVGRDTDNLDEMGVVRAAVESVAENTVDGVVAPFFFVALGGPVGLMVYKAISTLDSMFGYRNESYLYFGRFAARVDDVAAWLPARLTFLLMVPAAALCGAHAHGVWRMGLRDARNHASPNAGWPEAAMAGALGVQLGGRLQKHGQSVDLPLIGDPLNPLSESHIPKAVSIMWITAALSLGLCLFWCSSR